MTLRRNVRELKQGFSQANSLSSRYIHFNRIGQFSKFIVKILKPRILFLLTITLMLKLTSMSTT